jgi:hypothetical protein
MMSQYLLTATSSINETQNLEITFMYELSQSAALFAYNLQGNISAEP